MLGNSYSSLNYEPASPSPAAYSRAAHYLDTISEEHQQPDQQSTHYSQSNYSFSQSFPNSIGEYGMGRLLGRGAFGSVYEVTEIRRKTPLNDFKYAIKIVRRLCAKRFLICLSV